MSTPLVIQVTQLAHGQGLALPAYASVGAAGMDLVAALPAHAPLTLQPGQRGLVPTGLAMALPQGLEGQVRPRSGLALRQGITILNAPGTIDADYRGEVQVLMVNLGQEPVTLSRGERIAQLVIAPARQATLVLVEALDNTARSTGGFGSTGV